MKLARIQPNNPVKAVAMVVALTLVGAGGWLIAQTPQTGEHSTIKTDEATEGPSGKTAKALWTGSAGIFLKEADQRFAANLTNDQAASFRNDAAKLKANNQLNEVTASELVYRYAKLSDARSAVKISSSKGSGAKISYQTLGERARGEAATTAKELTTAIERMYWGKYFIWSERDGHETSDRNSQFSIMDAKEKVVLQENR